MEKLVTFLMSITELKQNSNYLFANNQGFPFTEILLLNAKNIDSWSENNFAKTKVNLLAIVCEKGNDENFQKLKMMFIKIANFLSWQLVDEETDDGIENFIIWESKR
ncbi:hypothetical protein [Flavobacterium suncheonense]|nr:hypothetical protein [Flavobacterium suncheonense]